MKAYYLIDVNKQNELGLLCNRLQIDYMIWDHSAYTKEKGVGIFKKMPEKMSILESDDEVKRSFKLGYNKCLKDMGVK